MVVVCLLSRRSQVRILTRSQKKEESFTGFSFLFNYISTKKHNMIVSFIKTCNYFQIKNHCIFTVVFILSNKFL